MGLQHSPHTSTVAILTSQNGDWWEISPSECCRRIISRTSAPYLIFRKKIHLKPLEGLFEQVLKIALEAGALKVGRVALDGTKIKANVSKHK